MNAGADASALKYPHASGPEPGDAMALADGVLWCRMPLPGALTHINVWAVRSGAGWTIVDTGLNTPETFDAWTKVFAGALEGSPVEQVICTHMHPDHIGVAGWITRRFRCPLLITRLEYLTCRTLVADTGRPAPEDGVRFYRAAGWDHEAIEGYKKRFGGFGKMIYEMPDSFRRLEDGDMLELGAYRWRVVVGTGHSPEHACLYSEQLKLLISGDQVLPRISSNISLFPTEPDADPLSDWLESLARIKTTVPDDVLVLPAHGLPFHGLHARIDQLIAGHEKGLAALKAGLDRPHRVMDVFPMLFSRAIQGELLVGMATGESLAHLAYIGKRGVISRSTDENGVDWYQWSR